MSHQPILLRSVFAALLVFGLVLATLGIVTRPIQAEEVPPAGIPIYVQTNGPTAGLGRGDWYTSVAPGGAGFHYFTIEVPCGWPADLDIDVDLFSPEMNSNNPTGDEAKPSGPSNTAFELYPVNTAIGPGSAIPAPTANEVTFAPSTAPEAWVRFDTLTAPVECGSYVLRAATTGDDENAWRLRVGSDNDADPNNAPPANSDNPDGVIGTNDEVVIGVQITAYQHDVTAAGVGQCLTLYEFVDFNQTEADFHNFDMDGNQLVRYYPPSETLDPIGQTGGIAGTVSGQTVWNGPNGTGGDRGTGDVVVEPEGGWWRIVSCFNANNQIIQEGQTDAPSFYQQPPTPAMAVAKDDGVAVTGPGEQLTYTINFTNTATGATAGAATNVSLSDTLPANTTYVSCAITPPLTGTCSEAAGVATFSLNETVNAGDSGSVTVTVSVNPDATDTVSNSVTLNYEDGFGNRFPPQTATDIDRIPPVDLQLGKTDNGISIAPGDVIAYTLTYTNVGTATATGVVITETVPANTTFNAAGSQPTAWSCADGSPAGTACVTAIGTVVSGSASPPVTFAVQVDNPVPAGIAAIVNTATIADDGASGPDATPRNNTATKTTPLNAAPDLEIVKRLNGPPSSATDTITYTLDYANTGNQGATGVVINEVVPNNTIFNAGASLPDVWSCADGSPAGTTCTFTVGTVASGETGSAIFAVTLANVTSGGSLTNVATINDDGGNGPDPTPENNTSRLTTPIPSFSPDPTAIDLVGFTATLRGGKMQVVWETSAELDTYGFEIYRGTTGQFADAVKITPDVILAQGRGQAGARYTWEDTTVTAGVAYNYWLVEVEVDGSRKVFGPVSSFDPSTAAVRTVVFLPLLQR